MHFNDIAVNPFQLKISFHKVIENLAQQAQEDGLRAEYARALLQKTAPFPALIEGIDQLADIDAHKEIINELLSDLFPKALTNNEIKAVSVPFIDITFNYTQRFQNILDEAGTDFDVSIRDLDDDQSYIFCCILILNVYYQQQLDFTKPLFYDIPDKKGITKHYRILYNGDFIEILPTEQSVAITADDIAVLIDNFDNIALWKEKFPPRSWILKGFGIISLYDATTENAVSNLKTGLLRAKGEETDFGNDYEKIFQSIFKIPDLRLGFTYFISEETKFNNAPKEKKLHSFLLNDDTELPCSSLLNSSIYDTVVTERKTLAISNLGNYIEHSGLCFFESHLQKQNIQSCILAPVVKDDTILGIIELVSTQAGALNSLNATKLDLIMPYIRETIIRYDADIHHRIESVIQKEYTSIHPSVYWKFQNEARHFIVNEHENPKYLFKDIVFQEVYPLYGQVDVKESSVSRNLAIQNDIKNQLESLIHIVSLLQKNSNLTILEQRKFELEQYYAEIIDSLKADTEQQIQRYIETEIHPILKNELTLAPKQAPVIQSYFDQLDSSNGAFYQERKKFDTSLALINQQLSIMLDAKQKEAQTIYPHYFERFNTDGVEHNIYIGGSIVNASEFNLNYLYNIRLWQLQVLAQMVQTHYQLLSENQLPFPLEVTSLLLVFSSPITIRFRMDEKRFDVDGSYNARYEVEKKRIDKALEKGTSKRITQAGKITIVYSHSTEKKEYLKYIAYLQFQKILESKIEHLEIEDLQGVSGLKAIRVQVALGGQS